MPSAWLAASRKSSSSAGVEGLRTGQGRLQQGGVSQATQTAAYLNHRLMDCLYIGA